MRSIGRSLVGLAVALGSAACGSEHDGSGRRVTVFAAASLTEAFVAIGAALEVERPELAVTFNFASSSNLVAQINQGAPADVFASADQPNMARLLAAGNEGGPPEVFATNALAIIVERGNPVGIDGLGDLEDPDVVVVTGDPSTPIGAYAAAVFDTADVTVEADSFEEDAKAVVNKVVLGEADAGLVYATDVLAAGNAAEGVSIPSDVNVRPEYPIAVTAGAGDPEAAGAFVEFVTGAVGRQLLTEHGFGTP